MKSSPPILPRLIVGSILLAFLILYATAFQVAENERAVLVRLGEPVREINEPGLFFKWPWPVETVQRFETRLILQDLRLTETLTRDKRNVIVPLYVAWRIERPLRLIESLGGLPAAGPMLENMITSAKNTVLGQRDFRELVSLEENAVDLEGIERDILQRTHDLALEQFGVRITQIGIRRITLPEPNTPAVLGRMRAERSQFAASFRAEGRQRADEIRVRTESEASLLEAEARAYAERRRGEAEAEAAAVFAQAFSANPDFFRFLRRLETLEAVIDRRTTLVIDGAEPPFNLLRPPFRDSAGTPSPATGEPE